MKIGGVHVGEAVGIEGKVHGRWGRFKIFYDFKLANFKYLQDSTSAFNVGDCSYYILQDVEEKYQVPRCA